MATLVTISGTLADFSLDALAPFHPRLIFKAENAAVSDHHLLSARRIVVVPDASGAWSVQLVPSSQTTPETTYKLSIDWLVDISVPDVRDGLDILHNIVVPEADANIGDLPSTPKDRIWVGPLPPSNPQPGLWWLDTSAYPYVWKEWV